METTKWGLDPMHSQTTFKVKHMMIAHVTGSFNKFNVDATAEDNDFTKGKIHFSADVDSIDTNNEQRDGHLKGAEFFDIANFPQVSFESTSMHKKNDNEFELKGDLTIKGVTKPVSLNVEFGGIGKDPYGNIKAGFTIEGKINRRDFGLSWNATLEKGGLLIGEDIKLHSEIQLKKQ